MEANTEFLNKDSRPTLTAAQVKFYWEQEKDNKTPFGDMTLEQYTEEIKMVFNITE